MNILITEPEGYSSHAIALYKRLGHVWLLPDTGKPLHKAIADADAVVIRLGYLFDNQILTTAEKLRYIISPTTGLDHIDLEAAAAKNITIISLQGESQFLASIPSTAEFTRGLLLALIRQIPAAAQHVSTGGWNRNLFKGQNLNGRKLALLGLGRVGKQVATYAKAFGMRIMAYDPAAAEWPARVQKAENPEDLFTWGDILSIHIPLAGNEGFVSPMLLHRLKKGAFVINTSRGKVWDEACVAGLLSNGYIGGIATDVLDGEMGEISLQKNPLLALAGKGYNLIITPHIAGATHESMKATEDFVAEKFQVLLLAGEMRS